MKISIIVPAFNEEKLIERSLQSIRSAATAFSQVGWEHQIIVCDNNSSDRTGELSREQGAHVFFEPGPAGRHSASPSAQNIGAKDSPLLIGRVHLLPAYKFSGTGDNIQRSRSLRALVRRQTLARNELVASVFA